MKSYFFVILLIINFLGSISAQANLDSNDQILISVGDFKNSKQDSWSRQICQKAHTLFNQISVSGASIYCRKFEIQEFKDSYFSKNSQNYRYHLRISRTFDDRYLVEASNLKRSFESDFETVSWTLTDGVVSGVSKDQGLTKVLSNFFYFISNERTFKAVLLDYGSATSESIEKDLVKGQYRSKLTKQLISDFEAYRIYEKENPAQKNFLRTGVEIGVTLSAGLALYYKNIASMRVDHDYELWEGLQKKASGEAILFDDNDKFANYGHVFAGVLYYQIARANGFGTLESFLITFATSAAWEILEYQEVLSLNDQIMTPVGGYVIGEATYQVTCALLQKSLGGKLTGYTINPGMALNHGLDRIQKKSKLSTPPDCQKPRWSEISIFLGKENEKKPKGLSSSQSVTLGIEAEVVTIDNYGKEGQASRFVFDTSLAKAFLEKSGGEGAGDLKVIAQLVSAAYYQKDIQKDERGDLKGYDFLVGVGSATTWHDLGGKEKTNNEDFYGTINVLGASAKAQVYFKGTKLKMEVGFYGDFAMVKAWSMSDFDENTGGDRSGQASVVQRKGYYWGVGTSTLSAITWDIEKFKVAYKAQISNSSNTKSMHRFQQSATAQVDFQDQIVVHEISVSFKLTKNVQLTALREVIYRKGSFSGIASQRGKYDRVVGKLVYLF